MLRTSDGGREVSRVAGRLPENGLRKLAAAFGAEQSKCALSFVEISEIANFFRLWMRFSSETGGKSAWLSRFRARIGLAEDK
jgi:hypothetical protein